MNAEQGQSNSVMSRDPQELPPELTRGNELPDNHDPLTDGILMLHQKNWLEDTSPLKVASKGRRTGITYTEALDATIIAATDRTAGGDNYFYIGDTKDKGREFIGYVAHFARVVQGELAKVEEFLFEDQQDDGSSKFISAYRVRFKSGYRVEALSSNPANIRGLQGVVCIDEAAYHSDVRKVIDAVNALLIWMGRVRVISTHNGVLNPFNELITEARAGKNNFSVHHIPFQLAVDNGLYARVCLIKGIEYTKKGEREWERTIRQSYGTRENAMKQELDAVPSDAEGAALTRVSIERATVKGIPVLRWQQKDSFKGDEKEIRKSVQKSWCDDNLKDVLEGLDKSRGHVFGEDFARSGDRTAIIVFEMGRDLKRRCKLILEMGNIPYEQQRDTLFYICDRLPRLLGGALDATGNGGYLAEVAAQRYGECIHEVKFSQQWYRENSTPYTEAFGDETLTLPKDEDIIRDHQALAYVGDIIRVPEKHRHKGEDGEDRHGDTAIAGMLAWYASRQDTFDYGYETSSDRSSKTNSSRHRADRDRPRRSVDAVIRGSL